MARNADFNLTRTKLIEAAYRKIGLLGPAGLTPEQHAAAVEVLNLLVREESGRDARHLPRLWAETESVLFMQANRSRYNVAQSGVATGIVDLLSAVYRDSSGDDSAVDIMGEQDYARIQDKNDTGTPAYLYLKRHTDLASQELWVWPVLASPATGNNVPGTNGLLYDCTMSHTSTAGTRPITGSDWALYWWNSRGTDWRTGNLATTSDAWATATAYTHRQHIRYVYHRPLYDFDEPGDNPDFPKEWTRYFVYRLAHDLAPEYGLSLEERAWLKQEYEQAEQLLFTGLREVTTTYHHKVKYY